MSSCKWIEKYLKIYKNKYSKCHWICYFVGLRYWLSNETLSHFRRNKLQYLKFAFPKANRLEQIAVTILVLERRTAGWKSTCIWKVLRPGQLCQVFPWCSSFVEQMPNRNRTTLHHTTDIQPFHRTGTAQPCTTPLSLNPSNDNFKISTQKQPPNTNSTKFRTEPKCSAPYDCWILQHPTSHHTSHTHSHALYLASSLPLPERREGTSWESNRSKFSFFPSCNKICPFFNPRFVFFDI